MSNNSVPQTCSPPALNQVETKALKPHPRNSSIYGDEDVSELIELICQSGWVKPLVITSDNVIISGHRRWKAAFELGIEAVPVEVREFPNELAELEALLLENVSRFKTTEQKVREAQAWKDVETEKSRVRQLSNLKQNSSTTVPPNLAEREKGETREKVAKLVGLKRTTYEKAAKVVRVIDAETGQGNLEHATGLRKILNEQSVDAALQLLKKPCNERHQVLSLIGASKAKNTKEAFTLIQQRQDSAQKPGYHHAGPSPPEKIQSCWNCQHRLESVDEQSIYCNKFGILNLINKSGDERGQECSEWKDISSPLESLKKSTFILNLFLPTEWQNRLEETAASLGIDPAIWVTNLIGASLFPSSHSDNIAIAKSSEKHQEAEVDQSFNKCVEAITP